MLQSSVVSYKLRAASVSLAVFLVFATVVGFITYHCWFPRYLFWADGGIQGLRLIYSVDFVLGPVLALVFFHPEKTRGKLLFDIAVIATIQIVAMAWGTYQVYSQRPIAVVYGSHRFTSVASAIMDRQHRTPESLKVYSKDEPPYVYRREPRDDREKQRQTVMLMRYGLHFEAQAWLFQPFLPNIGLVFDRQQGVHEYIRKFLGKEWDAWVADRPDQSLAAYRFGFYQGRYKNAVLIFSPQGEYLGHLAMGETLLPDIKPDPLSR